ncbi:MAG TPA: PEGA domain-containing protein [Polyangiaceae bacterium]|nr:PEGA domain-containing protein [Polyangiaceae bacterium]
MSSFFSSSRAKFARMFAFGLGTSGLLAPVCALAAPPEASTQDASLKGGAAGERTEEEVRKAGEHYDRGLKLYTEGDHALAVIEFERAYRIVPDYRVLYNIGQVHIQLAHYAKARGALEQYVKEGGNQISADRRAAVQSDLEMLTARTATLRVQTNVPGAEILVDDSSVGVAPLDQPLLLDAGEHRVTVQMRGYETRTKQLTLAGRDNTELKVEIEKRAEGQSSIIVQKVGAESDRTTWLWATWSATGAFAIASVTTELLGAKAASDLKNLRADPDATRSELDSASRRARTLLTVGDVLGGLAIASGGVALYMTLSSDKSEPEKDRAPVSKGRVALVVQPSYLGIRGSY